MEIIVKKDILGELQAKGIFQNIEEGEIFLENFIAEMIKSLSSGHRVYLEGFGNFYASAEQTSLKNLDSITEGIAKNSNFDKERAEKAIKSFLEYLKEKILKNYEVHIMNFASFRIEESKKTISSSKQAKRKTAVSYKKTLLALIEKNFLDKITLDSIQFEADADFHKQINKIKSSSILLVVPEQDFFVKTIEYYFEKVNWKVNTVQNIEEAKKNLQTTKSHLILLDTRVENHQELCEEVKCKLDNDIVPIILLYPKGTDLKRATDFRICGDEHIIEPFEVKRLFQIAESVLRRIAQEKILFRQEVLFQFPTMDQHIEKANDFCSKLLLYCGLDEESQVTLGAAFREALANAAQHGNKYRRDKMLEVLYLLDKQKIILSVTDSGPGFDWQNFVRVGQTADAIGKARQSYKEGRLGGLGIMLMSRCVDKIEYNDSGNVITLTKYIAK